MIKTNSLNKSIVIGLSLILAYILFVAYMRFTHQDIGWYYAYADRLAGRFSLNHTYSTWSFVDANGDNGAGGIIFILLQFITIIISSNDLVAIKILAALIAFSTYLCFYYLLKNRLKVVYPFAFSLLLIIDPLFPYQVMNRPEMLAGCIALLVLYIGLNNNSNPWKFFVISFLTALLLDIHPISVFMVAGFNLLLFIKHYRKILYFAAGGIVGLALVTGLNYIFNGTPGIFAFFGNSEQYMNDHYFPLFVDPIGIIISRPFIKLKYLVVYFLFGILLFYIIRYFKPLKTAFFKRTEYRILLINACVFFLLSNLFSEGGNGYHLYSLLIYLPVFIIIFSELIKMLTGNARLIFIAFLAIIPLYGLFKSVPRIIQWTRYNAYFKANYSGINSKVSDGDRLLLRPNFSFALSGRKVHCEPTYPILMNMYYHKRSFPEAVLAKDFDIIAIDERFLHDADAKTPVNKYSNGPFYKSVEEVKFDTAIIGEMVKQGSLEPVYEFSDFYHGKTVFYRVNQAVLRDFVSNR